MKISQMVDGVLMVAFPVAGMLLVVGRACDDVPLFLTGELAMLSLCVASVPLLRR